MRDWLELVDCVVIYSPQAFQLVRIMSDEVLDPLLLQVFIKFRYYVFRQIALWLERYLVNYVRVGSLL